MSASQKVIRSGVWSSNNDLLCKSIPADITVINRLPSTTASSDTQAVNRCSDCRLENIHSLFIIAYSGYDRGGTGTRPSCLWARGGQEDKRISSM